LVEPSDGPLITMTRTDPETLPRQVTLAFSSDIQAFQSGVVRSAKTDGRERQEQYHSIAITLHPTRAQRIVERLHQEALIEGQTFDFSLPPSFGMLEPGDVVDLKGHGLAADLRFCIKRVVDGGYRQIEAYRVDPSIYGLVDEIDEYGTVSLPLVFGPPDIVALDLPAIASDVQASHNVKIAAYADPWPGAVSIYSKGAGEVFEAVQSIDAPAITGVLVDALPPGPVGFIHRGASVRVEAPDGSLGSVAEDLLLRGSNLAAIVSTNAVEVVQFAKAQLEGAGQYRLQSLVRGLGGTEAAAQSGSPAGARLVMLDETVSDLAVSALALSNGVTLRGEPVDNSVGDFSRTDIAATAIPRSLRPLSPVHLRARRLTSRDVAVSWVRRSRGAADLWELASIPLNEETEAYRVTVRIDGVALRQVESATPNWTYSQTDQLADGLDPSDAQALEFEVLQVGTGGRAGEPQTLDVIV
jgi:hypothetical protein